MAARVKVADFEAYARENFVNATFDESTCDEDFSTHDMRHMTEEERIRERIQASLQNRVPSIPDTFEQAIYTLASTLPHETEVFRGLSREVNYMPPRQSTTVLNTSARPGADKVVVQIALLHPHKAIKLHEHVFLSSHTLADVHERMYCVTYAMPKAVSEEPAGRPFDLLTRMAGFESVAAYFVIENVAYRDARQPASGDTSALMRYANEHSMRVAPEVRVMQDVALRELSLRPDTPYLYLHHGSCAHYVVVTGVRMLSNEDSPAASDYPIMVYQGKVTRRKCTVCDIFSATVVAYGDMLADQNPALYCQRCYRALHYKRDGTLDDIPGIRVYPYLHE